MDDLISRQAAIDAVIKRDANCGIDSAEVLKLLPSAAPERKTGTWIDTGSGQECSECGEIQYGYDNGRNFCANCGADMRGKHE